MDSLGREEYREDWHCNDLDAEILYRGYQNREFLTCSYEVHAYPDSLNNLEYDIVTYDCVEVEPVGEGWMSECEWTVVE